MIAPSMPRTPTERAGRTRTRRFVSWNVNGICSVVRKGFLEWLRSVRADTVGLQEVRAELDEAPEGLRARRRFPHVSWSSARSRRGYSGVAIFSKEEPQAVRSSLGDEAYDREARFLLLELADLLVVNAYFPKGSGVDRDNSRVPYKLAFTERVFATVDAARRATGKPALIMGDFNIAPTPLDLARPNGNRETSGFLPEERELYARCLARGYVDTFRALHPTTQRYTWWSNLFGVRERDIGWRIDHILVSTDLLPRVRRAFIWCEVRGSDHCPVGVDLER
jgi:exodeoxyribonuclease-3